MTIIHLRKRNLRKKKPLPPQKSSRQKEKQKVVIDEEVEDFISIEIVNDQGNLNNTSRKRLFERQMNQHEHLISRKLKGSLAKRWISGARR